MRREYRINPEKLPDEKWLKLYAEYRYTEKERYELAVAVQKQALAEIINQLFPDKNE